MSIAEVGAKLVALCNEGKSMECLDTLYHDDTASIEMMDFGGMPARVQGLAAIRGKAEWFYANNEVHSFNAEGPFFGNDPDVFGVIFDADMTPKGGERMKMREMALYTVKDGKVVEERFMNMMPGT